jgi:hypothetical protein
VMTATMSPPPAEAEPLAVTTTSSATGDQIGPASAPPSGRNG